MRNHLGWTSTFYKRPGRRHFGIEEVLVTGLATKLTPYCVDSQQQLPTVVRMPNLDTSSPLPSIR